MKGYKISEIRRATADFKRVFNVLEFAPFYDGEMTIILRKICINIVKFDDYLREVHGDYENEGKSMIDIITEKYGVEGVEIIDKLT